MSAITTHVLDTSRGKPAAGIAVTLEIRAPDLSWKMLGQGTTDTDGRLKSLLPAESTLQEGIYRLTFEFADYFSAHHVEAFYPHATVAFRVRDAQQHYHVPLLLNPYGYSTYRGS